MTKNNCSRNCNIEIIPAEESYRYVPYPYCITHDRELDEDYLLITGIGTFLDGSVLI
jgi:hypothetical protein